MRDPLRTTCLIAFAVVCAVFGARTLLEPDAIGLVLAVAASGVVRGLLYGISPSDPVTWIGVAVLILSSALVATVLPARRATRVDPVTVLNAGE